MKSRVMQIQLTTVNLFRLSEGKEAAASLLVSLVCVKAFSCLTVLFSDLLPCGKIGH